MIKVWLQERMMVLRTAHLLYVLYMYNVHCTSTLTRQPMVLSWYLWGVSVSFVPLDPGVVIGRLSDSDFKFLF